MKLPTCAICKKPVKPDCDWNQGRCPHRPLTVNIDHYQARFYNLMSAIKNFFRKK